jgi:hypothetical protein
MARLSAKCAARAPSGLDQTRARAVVQRQFEQGGGDGLRVERVEEYSRLADDLGQGRDGATGDRDTSGHGLDDRQTEAFVERGKTRPAARSRSSARSASSR